MYYVYLLTNTINGKRYVGQTGRKVMRLREHMELSGNGHFSSKGLYEDIRTQGIDTFKAELIGTCDTKREALIEEALMIFKFDSHIKGYNSILTKSYLGKWEKQRKKEVWVDAISKFELAGHPYKHIDFKGVSIEDIEIAFNL